MRIVLHSNAVQMGAFVNDNGLLFVVYYVFIIAVLGADGQLILRNPGFPMYLIEYLIALPTPDHVRLN